MSAKVPKNKKRLFLNTIGWGLALWFFGYVLGIILFAFVPQAFLGWAIAPLGMMAMLWVLFRKIERKNFVCYIGLAVFWTLIAVIFDYLFIVKLLGSVSYYKLDVYFYYVMTFVLPITVGWYKFHLKIVR